jgi:hypothetical protein
MLGFLSQLIDATLIDAKSTDGFNSELHSTRRPQRSSTPFHHIPRGV